MKKVRILALILAIVFAFGLVACSSGDAPANTPADKPADTPADKPADTPADKPADDTVYNLTFNYFGPESIGPGLYVLEIADKIMEKSEGRIQIECFFNGTLLGTEDTIAGCINRTADLCFVDSTVIGEVFPLNAVFSMPYLATPPAKAEMDVAYAQLLKDCPELEAELNAQGLTWMSIVPCGAYHLHGINTMFDDPAKLTGKTLDGLGEGGNLISALGGQGVTLDPGDYYLSCSTGLLDGMLAHWAMMTGFALSEVLTTHVVFSNDEDLSDYMALWGGGLYAPLMGTIMNQQSLAELPEDLQQIVREVASPEVMSEFTNTFDCENSVKPAVDVCVQRGDEFIFVGDEERGEWTYGIETVIDTWYARCEAAGVDGHPVYDQLMELFAAAN